MNNEQATTLSGHRRGFWAHSVSAQALAHIIVVFAGVKHLTLSLQSARVATFKVLTAVVCTAGWWLRDMLRQDTWARPC